jgi:osmotically-inducible protein OsmY
MNRYRIRSRRLVPLALVITAGCQEKNPPPKIPAPAPARETASKAPSDEGVVPDDVIVAHLERQLAADPVLSERKVGVAATSGIVTLSGTVEDPLEVRRAISLAHVIRGVRAVVDNMGLVARPAPDDVLASWVQTRLSDDAVTADEPVVVRAHGGVVVLSGSVDADATRSAAGSDALAVAGVQDVDNRLAIAPRSRQDARVEREIERSLRNDAWTAGSHIDVHVDGGVAHLSGWVVTPAQRSRAAFDAATATPIEVDLEQLQVDPSTDDGTIRHRADPRYQDGDIGQALLDAYVQDARVHPFAPSVEVVDGVITLRGKAPNPEAARAAGEDARNVIGAAAVHDHLTSREPSGS